MGLTCIAGNPYGYNMGNLKTYFSTVMACLDESQGRKIISNYHLEIPHTYVSSLDEAIDLLETETNISMFLDELSSWIDCYDKPTDKNGGKDLKNLAKQTRKVKNKLWYTSQCYSDIPNALRKLTSKVYITGKYHIINGNPIECTDDDCRTNNYLCIYECKISKDDLIQMSIPKFYPVIPEIFKIYNTDEIIYTKKCEPVNYKKSGIKKSGVKNSELIKKVWI